MARRKDLAGLAALGALGMMLSKGKKTVVEEPGEINERMDRANAISRGKTNLVDTGMSTPEPAENFSRRDAGMFEKEPDENYRNSGPRTSPTARPMVRPRTSPAPRTEINFGSLNKPEVTPDSVKNLAGAFNVPIRPRQRLSEDGVPYKKGGAVKKMASGGIASSASKRADGIAQKGKTRGKVC